MFYIHYNAFFEKIKFFLQKIEKMFDFCPDSVRVRRIHLHTGGYRIRPYGLIYGLRKQKPCPTVRSGRGDAYSTIDQPNVMVYTLR